MPSASQGLAQDLQRTTATRGLAAEPDRFEGRSRHNSLSPNGRPSGVLAAGEGPTTMILKGPVQVRAIFSLITLFSVPLRSPCRIVAAVLHTQTQPVDCIFGATEERVRERGVPPVFPGDCEGVLFTHELVGALLALTSKVAISEMVAIEALISTAI